MKRVVLVTALLVVGGTASAAIFVPASAPGSTSSAVSSLVTPAKVSDVARPSAPVIVDTGRAPVPFMPPPKPPAPEIASLTEPPAQVSQVPQQVRPQAAPARVTERDIRDLSAKDGRCMGRPLRSVRVEPDGRVLVRC